MSDKENYAMVPAPDEARKMIKEVNQFQAIVRELLVNGLDYGVIPGTKKPTLLKAGAEKIIKILRLTDSYEFIDRQEDWTRLFFRYLIKCRLTRTGTDVLVTEGLGECNSMEPKYRYRWLFQSDLPEALRGDVGKELRDKLPIKTIPLRRGGTAKQYRTDNDEIAGGVNTILKMARKRALVDAALTAGRLSQIFTQDIEDTAPAAGEVTPTEPSPVTEPALESKPAGELTLLPMYQALQKLDPKMWTDELFINTLDRRSGHTSKTIDEALASLTPEALAEVTLNIRKIYERALKWGNK